MSEQPALRWQRSRWERALDRGFVGLCLACACGLAGTVAAIGLTLAWRAWPAIAAFGWKFLTTAGWNAVPGREGYGLLAAIAGTLLTSLLALALALPLGVGTAIFLSEPLLPARWRSLLGFGVELLAAIPSVVYGLWGFLVLVPLLRAPCQWLHDRWGWFPPFGTAPAGPGVLPAAIVLAVMVLPLLTAVYRDALRAVPLAWREAAIALGSSRWQTLGWVLLPATRRGLLGALLLAFGRAIGESIAVALLVGNVHRLSPSLFAPATTIAALLANQFVEAKGLQVAALMYAALVLLGLALAVNLLAERFVAGRSS